MKISIALTTAALIFSTSVFAKEEKKVERIAKPDCTSENSPFEVIAGKCNLVKGVSLYGDIAGLSSLGINGGVSGVAEFGVSGN